ncbi:hypothetical protein LLE49_18500 [Alicyclobacillus tolerans]|uniref:glycerophosphodiester phosphodiesterase n=1 Tax=Alicyclobacillus tolerans TaxID=90970 RepID=UPI001F16ED63|nr:glycerophosphodiester phosphodiesterase family protein [Alicyclobacillus tolerans]MCF8566718.1 hypothetical protein [Alicyclobacillus tolerans]
MKTQSKVLAHRGFSAKYPENTLLAFRKAFELPIEGLEFDVHITADEVPVVIHDAKVDRTTDGQGRIALMDCDAVRTLNASAHRPEFGFQSVPTLLEVLNDAYQMRPDGLYNIEIKVDGADWKPLVDRVVSVVHNHPLKRRVLVSSFHHDCLAYLKERDASFEIGLLMADFEDEPWYLAKQLNAYSVNLDYRNTTDDLVRGCRDHQIRTAVWTVDEPETIRRFMRLDTDLLITNVPDVAESVRSTLAETALKTLY